MKLHVLVFLVVVGIISADDPPATWQEDWFEHNQLLKLHFFNDNVAIYFDDDVDQSLTWMNTYLHDGWVYTKGLYGEFGDDKRLYGIFHTGKYGGGHPANYFDSQKSYRNAIDVGSLASNAWEAGTGNDLDIVTHEIGHIVEGASHGVHNSPAFNIWGDSKWAEIYIYDVYLGLGRQDEATRWHELMLQSHDNFPRENTYWFKDWFLPIYDNFGGSQVLNQFFVLLSQNFPQNNDASFNRLQYTRSMNHGEFFHFWSGAAGVNLKDLATVAFGWSDQYEQEFSQAQKDFPEVTYNGK